MPAEGQRVSWFARVSCQAQWPPRAGPYLQMPTQLGKFRSYRPHSSVPALRRLQTSLKAQCPVEAEREKRKISAGKAAYHVSRKRKTCSGRIRVGLWKGVPGQPVRLERLQEIWRAPRPGAFEGFLPQ